MKRTAPCLLIVALSACGGPARLPLEAGIGPRPLAMQPISPQDVPLFLLKRMPSPCTQCC